MTQAQHHTVRRGDNIPTVADYAHYNEEAEIVWYAENRYDMEHADEIISDDWDADDREDRYAEEEDHCTGNSDNCPVDHDDDPDGLCPDER